MAINEEIISGSKTMVHCCTLEASFETNGYQGGDAGHGGWLEITLKDHGGTSMLAAIGDEKFSDCMGGKIRLRFEGDSEMSQIVEALEFLARNIDHALSTPRQKKAGAA